MPRGRIIKAGIEGNETSRVDFEWAKISGPGTIEACPLTVAVTVVPREIVSGGTARMIAEIEGGPGFVEPTLEWISPTRGVIASPTSLETEYTAPTTLARLDLTATASAVSCGDTATGSALFAVVPEPLAVTIDNPVDILEVGQTHVFEASLTNASGNETLVWTTDLGTITASADGFSATWTLTEQSRERRHGLVTVTASDADRTASAETDFVVPIIFRVTAQDLRELNHGNSFTWRPTTTGGPDEGTVSYSYGLSGVGMLTDHGDTATYRAPDDEPVSNETVEVTITARKGFQTSTYVDTFIVPHLPVTIAITQVVEVDGASRTTFAAMLEEGTGNETVEWVLTGPGTLSRTSGLDVLYTAPPSGSTDQNVELTATVTDGADTASETALFIVRSRDPPEIVILERGTLVAVWYPRSAAVDMRAVLFNVGGNQTVTWTLDGPGTLSATTGERIIYGSPTEPGPTMLVALTARVDDEGRSATRTIEFIVTSFGLPPLRMGPGFLMHRAGHCFQFDIGTGTNAAIQAGPRVFFQNSSAYHDGFIYGGDGGGSRTLLERVDVSSGAVQDIGGGVGNSGFGRGVASYEENVYFEIYSESRRRGTLRLYSPGTDSFSTRGGWPINETTDANVVQGFAVVDGIPVMGMARGLGGHSDGTSIAVLDPVDHGDPDSTGALDPGTFELKGVMPDEFGTLESLVSDGTVLYAMCTDRPPPGAGLAPPLTFSWWTVDVESPEQSTRLHGGVDAGNIRSTGRMSATHLPEEAFPLKIFIHGLARVDDSATLHLSATSLPEGADIAWDITDGEGVLSASTGDETVFTPVSLRDNPVGSRVAGVRIRATGSRSGDTAVQHHVVFVDGRHGGLV